MATLENTLIASTSVNGEKKAAVIAAILNNDAHVREVHEGRREYSAADVQRLGRIMGEYNLGGVDVVGGVRRASGAAAAV